jgi:hypothetical protein
MAKDERPEVFGDGSTREQQDRLIREAEEANQQVRELADQQRAALPDQPAPEPVPEPNRAP